MALRIVYQLLDTSVSSMTPCDCGLTIQEIARQDVPHGVPFWIVDESVIPVDPVARKEWALTDELGIPAGLGERQPFPSVTEQIQ